MSPSGKKIRSRRIQADGIRPARPQPSPAMDLAITNRQRTRKIDRRRLRQIVSGLCAELGIPEITLGIHLVGASEMTRVNETFLRHAGSTDVITFDHSDPVTGLRPGASPLHGELFICVDEAVLQAKQFRTRWQSEVVRYIVHGVLHLQGHDDRRAVDRRRMKGEEDRLVRGLARRFSLAQLSGTVRIAE